MTDAGAEALHYYGLYLQEGADYIASSRRSLVEEEMEKLKAQLTPLTLAIEPAGTDVILDGKSIADPLGDTLYLDPGEHTLMLQKAGYKTHKDKFVAKRGEPILLEVSLMKEGEAGTGTGADGTGGDADSAQHPGQESQPPAKLPVQKEVVTKSKVPWGAAVGTGALTLASGVAAIVLGSVNSKHCDDYHALRDDIASQTYTGDDPVKSVEDAEDKGRALNAGVGVAIGVTAAAAIVTAILVPLAIEKKNVEVQTSGSSISVSVSF